ncbi:alpha/beta fold hydrolase [Methylobacterium nodulans]|uniref:Alpha/beta hydrolase fold protein n=1 Tax=Methylobacterium nodulans (strain LMG 21967 / CNCM I-2342 / ORS 2060) TaxID=460265 RepID=B8IM20_METNO|nr:alpha/beta hydrolase [Methylobacterium nodulans]ACL56364.1 alpha/beta hydrolase fold protein [Methylobacterium nodulans ORS 2060]
MPAEALTLGAAPLARETLDIGDPAGGRIAALAFGPRERPLDALVLHANGFTARTYRTLLEPLAGEARILACDQRGHGSTTLRADPRHRRSWNDLAADLVALLDRLDGPPLTLVGHSMGGTASLLAAARRPERVRNLVLLDPVILRRRDALAARMPFVAPRLFRRHSPLAEQAIRRRAVFPSRAAALAAYRGRGAFRTWPDAALADYVADGFRERPDGAVELACSPAWEAANFLAQGHDSWGALRRLARPALILRAASGSTCALTHDRPPHVTVETVPGTTHFLPFEAPERVRAAIRAAIG